MTGIIYKITSPSNRIYIGQTTEISIEKRYKGGVDKRQRKLYNSVNKYGWDLHIKEIIETIEFIDIKELDLRETHWIRFYNSIIEGLNCREGGNNGLLSEESKSKISNSVKEYIKNNGNSWKYKKHTQESLDLISKNRKGKLEGKDHFYYGKERTKEVKEKLSKAFQGEKNPNFGKSRNEETKKKIGKANKGCNNGMYGKKFNRNEEQIKNLSMGLLGSKKLKESRASNVYREKLSKHFSEPVLLLDIEFNIIQEFINAEACAIFLGYKKSNIHHAIKDLRKTGKKIKYWVVRKNLYLESIKIIKTKKI